MNHFTSDLVQALVTKQGVTEIFRKHLEMAMNRLLETELTAFLNYEKYDRIGVNSGNSRNGAYTRTLHTEYGDLQSVTSGKQYILRWLNLCVRIRISLRSTAFLSQSGEVPGISV